MFSLFTRTSGLDTSLAHSLYLHHIHGVGAKTLQRLYEKFGQVEAIFSAQYEDLIATGLKPKHSKLIKTPNRDLLDLVKQDLQWQQTTNCHVVCWQDDAYPALLKQIYDPPHLLYAVGKLAALQHVQLAIVGSRRPSFHGQQVALQIANDIVAQGISVTSGLALGIDACAHTGALQAGGPTIAVMACGLDTIYPYRHRQLAEQIQQNGLLLSELPRYEQPRKGLFPRRNRIISGLSFGTLVVEAALKSGSLITARCAVEQNREVFAVPGSVKSPLSAGCHSLIKQGAVLVQGVEDIIAEFPSYLMSPALCTNTPSPISLDLEPLAQQIYSALDYHPMAAQDIALRTELTIECVLQHLMQLELQGFIKLDAQGYVRI